MGELPASDRLTLVNLTALFSVIKPEVLGETATPCGQRGLDFLENRTAFKKRQTRDADLNLFQFTKSDKMYPMGFFYWPNFEFYILYSLFIA